MPTSPFGRRARLLLTLGDPAGIGPEVALKALSRCRRKTRADILLLGPAPFFRRLARTLGLRLGFRAVSTADPWPEEDPAFPCYFSDEIPAGFRRGRSDPALTKLAVRSIESGVRLLLARKAEAMVTPPIHKAALKEAGFKIPGHTEFLGQLSGQKNYQMMLIGGPLRVLVVTRHVALKDVPRWIKPKEVEKAILLADRELRRSFGIRRPRIAVCGLNPHAGEKGRFGREEIEAIEPAVRNAQRKTKAQIVGPLSPDALFCDAYRGAYDAEICMYHDQGLIPLKMIARGCGVNVTLGLPFVRTSPDHGTAYDIAQKFVADCGSFLQAMQWAVTMVRNRQAYDRSHPRG